MFLFKEDYSFPTILPGRISSQSKIIYKSEDVANITCNEGYVHSSLYTTCQPERYWFWRTEEPKCSVLTSNEPSNMLNGILTPDQPTFNFNTTVVLSCNDGYEITAHRTCCEDGTWGPELFGCVKIICNDYVNIRHESINQYPLISFNEVRLVVYNSSFFHVQEGSAEVHCSADGKLYWTKSPLFGR